MVIFSMASRKSSGKQIVVTVLWNYGRKAWKKVLRKVKALSSSANHIFLGKDSNPHQNGLSKKKRSLLLPDQEKYDSRSWKRKNTWRLDSKISALTKKQNLIIFDLLKNLHFKVSNNFYYLKYFIFLKPTLHIIEL